MAHYNIPEEEEEKEVVQVCQLEKSWSCSVGMRKVLLWTLSVGEQQGTPTAVLKHEVVWMLVFVVPHEKCLKCDSISTLAAEKYAAEIPWQSWMYSGPESHYRPIDAPAHYLLFGLLKKSCEGSVTSVTKHWRTPWAAGCRGGTGTFTGQEYVLFFIDGRCRKIRRLHWNITLPSGML